MKRDELGDLVALLAVIEEGSFTRAAARLETSQSSVSHTVSRLEKRLGVRLLTRTTRSVSPTEAGEKLAGTVRPAFAEIQAQLDNLSAYRQRPGGTIRLTSSKFVARSILFPAVERLMATYPDLNIEISIDHRLVDLAAEQFDAGVRLGEQVEKDMIAMRIGPDLRMVVAGAPEYLSRRGTPRTPHDLTDHNCINLRMPTLGGSMHGNSRKANGRSASASTVSSRRMTRPRARGGARRRGSVLAARRSSRPVPRRGSTGPGA